MPYGKSGKGTGSKNLMPYKNWQGSKSTTADQSKVMRRPSSPASGREKKAKVKH